MPGAKLPDIKAHFGPKSPKKVTETGSSGNQSILAWSQGWERAGSYQPWRCNNFAIQRLAHKGNKVQLLLAAPGGDNSPKFCPFKLKGEELSLGGCIHPRHSSQRCTRLRWSRKDATHSHSQNCRASSQPQGMQVLLPSTTRKQDFYSEWIFIGASQECCGREPQTSL